MPIESPLATTLNAIRESLASAAAYRTTLEGNEWATRTVLIDPLLRVLGWDLANTYMVEVEKPLGKSKVDYALFNSNLEIAALIEAKSLGSDLSKEEAYDQVLTYAFKSGIPEVFLTDGLVWQHFSGFQPGNIRPTRILDLSNDDLVDVAAYLVQHIDAIRHWPEDQTLDALARDVAQLQSTVSTLQQRLDLLTMVPLPTSPNPPVGTTPPSPPSPTEADFVLLSRLPSVTGRRPALLRLPDGQHLRVRLWKDVLLEACKYAMATNPAIPIPLADRAGRKVALFALSRPPQNISYVETTYNGKLLFIYTNYDANGCVANAEHILSHVPRNLQRVEPAITFS